MIYKTCMTSDPDTEFLLMADKEADKSCCIIRMYGAVIVNDGEVISTGFNSSPAGTTPCSDRGFCNRRILKVPRGTGYEYCRSVHAEANCIIKASPDKLNGATLYLSGFESNGLIIQDAEPCYMCKRLIINSNIRRVVVRVDELTCKVIDVIDDWVRNDITLTRDTYIKDE